MAKKKHKSGDFSKAISNIQKRIARAQRESRSENYQKDLQTRLNSLKTK